MSPGRKIAIDASMCMYQFLIAVRQDGNVLQNEDGETTRSLLSRHVSNCQNVDVHSCKADTEVSSLYQPPDGNVLPDNPYAGTWNQTGVCV